MTKVGETENRERKTEKIKEAHSICMSPLRLGSPSLPAAVGSGSSRKIDAVVKDSFNTTERPSNLCGCCTRRALLQSAAFFPICPSASSSSDHNYQDVWKKFHPPKPNWYEELYAWTLKNMTKSYEAEVERYKATMFSNLKGKAENVLEIGIGTGPNLRYYAGEPGVRVFCVDPNSKMDKYARSAALAAGLPDQNFKFAQAVGEALPLDDSSVDAVVGTLVLCSVSDVSLTLKEIKRVLKPGGSYLFIEHIAAQDGTLLRFIQKVLDPLQRTVSDGCHLTRETGKDILEAGFSDVQLNTVSVSKASFANPHVYGIASK